MDLKDFIRETLVQIVTGVRASQQEIQEMGGFASPSVSTMSTTDSPHFGRIGRDQHAFLVTFDITVVVSEEKGTDAKAKLEVASLLKLGAGGESSSSNVATNKISFTVPLALPVDEKSKQLVSQLDEEVRANTRAAVQRSGSELNRRR